MEGNILPAYGAQSIMLKPKLSVVATDTQVVSPYILVN